ncbi:saccharopine dehydrogenase NADP-binding domain-containing protein [Streptomyces luteolus]|uniref:Saccharopine dehydrogenase NADP-binding domain-containing protein n=1 Tax=Streptomyces luteolus TaxID=3043615 RepID=A0ABT6SVG3_9ACTN|nr:saccharopine dehydrogenase NADP-binding domain-containing protein [Streptomyces sp. B-S-A12]MDI3419576.1 saccharopine dehydrogenase NADP-binding domain-containing protein [Streptomyces sp. B-S-A12]
MRGEPLVGVLGGSGVVGRAAVRTLRELGVRSLRLGARRPPGVTADGVESVAVDLDDEDGLAAFCRDCRTVLNCAGPSYLVRGRVAIAALAAGADYVDVAGDDPAHADLRGLDLAATRRRAVLSAGMLPGLSGLLPRRLARHRALADARLAVWTGGLERCSRTVAADLMLSLGDGPDAVSAAPTAYGEALAAWRRGRRESHALSAQAVATLPFFPGTVAVQPYLSTEAERLAQALGLAELDWFNVFPGRQVRETLAALRGGPPTGPASLGAAADRLVRAAELDLAGRRPYYRMVFELSDGASTSTTAILGTTDSYRLTGAVGALTVAATLDGRVPPGLHYAAEVLDPDETTARIESLGAVTIDVSSGPVGAAATVGAL